MITVAELRAAREGLEKVADIGDWFNNPGAAQAADGDAAGLEQYFSMYEDKAHVLQLYSQYRADNNMPDDDETKKLFIKEQTDGIGGMVDAYNQNMQSSRTDAPLDRYSMVTGGAGLALGGLIGALFGGTKGALLGSLIGGVGLYFAKKYKLFGEGFDSFMNNLTDKAIPPERMDKEKQKKELEDLVRKKLPTTEVTPVEEPPVEVTPPVVKTPVKPVVKAKDPAVTGATVGQELGDPAGTETTTGTAKETPGVYAVGGKSVVDPLANPANMSEDDFTDMMEAEEAWSKLTPEQQKAYTTNFVMGKGPKPDQYGIAGEAIPVRPTAGLPAGTPPHIVENIVKLQHLSERKALERNWRNYVGPEEPKPVVEPEVKYSGSDIDRLITTSPKDDPEGETDSRTLAEQLEADKRFEEKARTPVPTTSPADDAKYFVSRNRNNDAARDKFFNDILFHSGGDAAVKQGKAEMSALGRALAGGVKGAATDTKQAVVGGPSDPTGGYAGKAKGLLSNAITAAKGVGKGIYEDGAKALEARGVPRGTSPGLYKDLLNETPAENKAVADAQSANQASAKKAHYDKQEKRWDEITKPKKKKKWTKDGLR